MRRLNQMNTLTPVTVLWESGQFATALRALDDIRIGAHERTAADVLRAELLERVGDYPKSRGLTDILLKKSNLLTGDRSACEMVLARIELEVGNVDQGISHLQRSITIASECHDIARVCWAQLRLLLVLCDRSGPDSVAPYADRTPRTRHAIWRSSDHGRASYSFGGN